MALSRRLTIATTEVSCLEYVFIYTNVLLRHRGGRCQGLVLAMSHPNYLFDAFSLCLNLILDSSAYCSSRSIVLVIYRTNLG
jgi:hypothetical protein